MEAFKNLCDIYCRYSNVDLCSVLDLIDRIGINNTIPIDPQLLKGLNPKKLSKGDSLDLLRQRVGVLKAVEDAGMIRFDSRGKGRAVKGITILPKKN